jgi:hypothetical protein
MDCGLLAALSPGMTIKACRGSSIAWDKRTIYRPLASICRNTAALGQQSTLSPLRF